MAVLSSKVTQGRRGSAQQGS